MGNKKSKNSSGYESPKAIFINDIFNGALIEDPIEFTEDDDVEAGSYCQWEVVNSETFYPGKKRKHTKKIPAGYYRINWDNQAYSFFLTKRTIKTDQLITLPIEEGVEIINDIKKFWDMKDRYKKYNLLHKRGILMYGPAGSGKSSIINQLVSMLVNDHKGIVFSIEDPQDLSHYISFSSIFRKIEPERPIFVIIEDIDGLLDGGRQSEKMLLNVLDGINQIDNVAYIASTNYPENLQERLINRPGRFDRRFKIGYPTAKVRKAFFESKLHKDDKQFDIKEMVKKTSKLTIAHCKEVFTEYVIKGRSLDEVVEEMQKLSTEKLHSDEKFGKNKVGFGGNDEGSWKDGFENISWDDPQEDGH